MANQTLEKRNTLSILVKPPSVIGFIALAMVLALSIRPAEAASQNECAAWLCITVGFAFPECAKSHRAMLKRMLKGKGPLPSFSSCSKDGNSNGLDAVVSVAALIDSEPKRYQHGTRCYAPERDHDHQTNPPNCIGSYRYVIVTQDGEQLGETFYMPIPNPPQKDCESKESSSDC